VTHIRTNEKDTFQKPRQKCPVSKLKALLEDF